MNRREVLKALVAAPLVPGVVGSLCSAPAAPATGCVWCVIRAGGSSVTGQILINGKPVGTFTTAPLTAARLELAR